MTGKIPLFKKNHYYYVQLTFIHPLIATVYWSLSTSSEESVERCLQCLVHSWRPTAAVLLMSIEHYRLCLYTHSAGIFLVGRDQNVTEVSR